jgi:hypothetical protein
MIGSARTLFVWSGFLGTLAIVLWAVFSGTWIEAALLGGAAVAVAATAATMLLRRSVSPGSDPDVERPLSELSVATTCVAAALAAILLGLQFGVWLVEIGGGLLVLGVGGLIRERRAEPPARRMRERR